MTIKPTIYLHIGAGKTGTTSIQTWLKRNEQQLREQKCLIFDSHFRPNHIDGMMSNQQRFFQDIIKYPDGGESQFQSRFRDNLAYMRLHNFESAIISAELIMTALPQLTRWLEPFLNECNWKIIAYVRNQPHYLISGWKEWGYWQHSFDDMFEETRYLRANWLEMLKPWASVFGADRIYLGIFENTYLVNQSIIHDFATAINTPHLVHSEHSEIQTNPSLSNKSAIFLSNIRHYTTQRTNQRYEMPNRSDFADLYTYQSAYRHYVEHKREDFQLKPLLLYNARHVSTYEPDNALSIATQTQLDMIYDLFKDSNRELLSQYRPDVNIDIAFPRVLSTQKIEYTENELNYHGFSLLLEMIKGINAHDKNQTQMIKQQSEQLATLHTNLHNQTRALWNVNHIQYENFVQIQTQFAEVQYQLTQAQQQFSELHAISRDLYARTNPLKYWIIRIWNRITRRTS